VSKFHPLQVLQVSSQARRKTLTTKEIGRLGAVAPTLHLFSGGLIDGHTRDFRRDKILMKRLNPLAHYCFILLTSGALAWGAVPMSAQSQSQTMAPQERQDRDDDLTRRQLADFDRFLDNHPEVAEQVRKDPSVVNKQEFVEQHPELQEYLQQHPEIREQLSQNPNGTMRQEQRFDRREDQDRDQDRDRDRERDVNRDRDVSRREMANMDRFMDSHPEIGEQLRKDPSLVTNKEFVQNHPALQQFLAEHPGVREEYKENPNGFMSQEQRYDRREDQPRDRDVTRREMANMDQFLDRHPEIAEQLRKDPSLVNNKQFVENHAALQQFLAEHPGVREEYKENPNGFMRQEQRYDRREDSNMRRDRDVTGGELSSFNEFLEGHGNIASELSKNPSLANNHEYLENHPELREYLKANPKVHEELKENPQTFLQSAQQFNTRGTPKVGGESKPK
jgi:phage-related protein